MVATCRIRKTHPMLETRSSSLELLPVVIVNDSSKHFLTLDTPPNGPHLPMERHRYLLSDTLMWSSSVVGCVFKSEPEKDRG